MGWRRLWGLWGWSVRRHLGRQRGWRQEKEADGGRGMVLAVGAGEMVPEEDEALVEVGGRGAGAQGAGVAVVAAYRVMGAAADRAQATAGCLEGNMDTELGRRAWT